MAGEMILLDRGNHVDRGYYDEDGNFLIAESVSKNSPRYAELTARPDLVQDKQWDYAARSPVAQAAAAAAVIQGLTVNPESHNADNLTAGPKVYSESPVSLPLVIQSLPGPPVPIDPGMSAPGVIVDGAPAPAPSWVKPALIIAGLWYVLAKVL